MNLILFGPPGAGKGTQSVYLSAVLGVPSISTGEILRAAVKNKTVLGNQASAVMQAGGLVSDEIVLGIVSERIADMDCSKGFILDGFPRTVVQAESLAVMLKGAGRVIDLVLSLEVDSGELVKRLSGRRSCSKCGKGYHVDYAPAVIVGTCDVCGSVLIQRSDDHEDAIASRLKIYEQQTEPLKSYYKSIGSLRSIDGVGSVDEIQQRIIKVLDDVRDQS